MSAPESIELRTKRTKYIGVQRSVSTVIENQMALEVTGQRLQKQNVLSAAIKLKNGHLKFKKTLLMDVFAIPSAMEDGDQRILSRTRHGMNRQQHQRLGQTLAEQFDESKKREHMFIRFKGSITQKLQRKK